MIVPLPKVIIQPVTLLQSLLFVAYSLSTFPTILSSLGFLSVILMFSLRYPTNLNSLPMFFLWTCEMSCKFPLSIATFYHHFACQVENLAHNWSVLYLINCLTFILDQWLSLGFWCWVLFTSFPRWSSVTLMISSITSGMVTSTYVSPPWSIFHEY